MTSLSTNLSSQEGQGQCGHKDPYPPHFSHVPAEPHFPDQQLGGDNEKLCGLQDHGSSHALLHVGHFHMVCCGGLPSLPAATHGWQNYNPPLHPQSLNHQLG